MTEELENKFAAVVDESMDISATRYGYDPTGMRTMITRRTAKGQTVVDAVIDLIHAGDVQTGFTRIWEISQKPGNSDAYKITLEWLVTRPEFRPLFEPMSREAAAKRLKDYFGVQA